MKIGYFSLWLNIYPGGGEVADKFLIKSLSSRYSIEIISLKSLKIGKLIRRTYKIGLIGKIFRDLFEVSYAIISLRQYNSIIYSGRVASLFFISHLLKKKKFFFNIHGNLNNFFLSNLGSNVSFVFWGRAKEINKLDLIDGFQFWPIGSYPHSSLDKNFQYTSISKNIKLFWVGRFEKIKNMRLLIDIARENKSIEFYVAGSGPESASFKKDKFKNIKWLGFLKKKDLEYYYDLCDFHIMTSYYENYPTVISEALRHFKKSLCPQRSPFLEMDFPNIIYYDEGDISNLTYICWQNKDLIKREVASAFFKIKELENKNSLKKFLDQIE